MSEIFIQCRNGIKSNCIQFGYPSFMGVEEFHRRLLEESFIEFLTEFKKINFTVKDLKYGF